MRASRHRRSGLDLNPSQSADRCFALQSATNRIVRTIVMAIHDKILIPRLTTATVAAIKRERERSEIAFLNIIRPETFYYSTRDRSGRQEFRSCQTREFSPNTSKPAATSSLYFFLSLFFLVSLIHLLFSPGRIRPYRRESNRQNYVVASAKRGISFLAFDGRSSVLCKDRTILFHVLEYIHSSFLSTCFLFSLSLSLSLFLFPSLFLSPLGISPTVGAINFIRATPLVLCTVTRPYIPIS